MKLVDAAIGRSAGEAILSLHDVSVGYGERIVQKHLSFDVRRGSIFALMGGSGAGKSTLLRSMIGLEEPLSGAMTFAGVDYWAAGDRERARIGRRFGVLFQSAALWSSLTVGENVALPLQMFTRLNEETIQWFVALKLALVGMEEAVDLLPAQLSGGMAKRAGLARAIALDPDVLFFDEPLSGLDPVTARRLDALIVDLRDALETTVVMVSHDLSSLIAIADDGVFLDGEARTAIAHGSPAALRDRAKDPRVREFMRGEAAGASLPNREDRQWQTLGSLR